MLTQRSWFFQNKLSTSKSDCDFVRRNETILADSGTKVSNMTRQRIQVWIPWISLQQQLYCKEERGAADVTPLMDAPDLQHGLTPSQEATEPSPSASTSLKLHALVEIIICYSFCNSVSIWPEHLHKWRCKMSRSQSSPFGLLCA